MVLPGIGCECFAGNFKGQMENKLDKPLQVIMEKHKFPSIKGIHLGFHGGLCNIKKEISGVIYEVRGNGLPQLSHPQEYNEEFRDCKLDKQLPGIMFHCQEMIFSIIIRDVRMMEYLLVQLIQWKLLQE